MSLKSQKPRISRKVDPAIKLNVQAIWDIIIV